VKTRVLDVSPEKWLTTTTYYDDRCRVIQTVSDNVQGFTSRLDMQYDFTGNVTKQKETHKVSSSRTDIVETTNTYDLRGRLLSSSTTLNDGASASTLYGYDAVGRLTNRTMGATKETTTYNVRDWLTGKLSRANNTLILSMDLYYEFPEYEPRWNGNISDIEWQHGGDGMHGSHFSYDGANRIIENNYYYGAYPDGSYSERLTYDLNGKIKT
jgi:hypothetical protein